MSLHLWDPPAQAEFAVPMPRVEPPPLILTAQNEQLHPAVQQPIPTVEGGYGTIMADVPWDYRSWVANENPESSRGADRHYRTMSLDEIAALPVKQVAAKDAHLFFWTTSPFLMKSKEIMRAWGFKYSSTGFVWMKFKRGTDMDQIRLISISEIVKYLHIGMGHTTRKNVEFCLLGRRGNARRLAKDVLEPILSPVREHSRKPDEAYDRAKRYAAGPFLELFSREEREGWTTWGNEAGKFER